MRAQARYDGGRWWAVGSVRYGSGLPVEVSAGDGVSEAIAEYGAAVVNRVDFEGGRVRPSVSVDAGLGVELQHRDRRRVALRGEVANLMNRLNVINFAGRFAGTAIAPPRSGTIRLQVEF